MLLLLTYIHQVIRSKRSKTPYQQRECCFISSNMGDNSLEARGHYTNHPQVIIIFDGSPVQEYGIFRQGKVSRFALCFTTVHDVSSIFFYSQYVVRTIIDYSYHYSILYPVLYHFCQDILFHSLQVQCQQYSSTVVLQYSSTGGQSSTCCTYSPAHSTPYPTAPASVLDVRISFS